MQVPLWSSARELNPQPRRFLLFAVFNVVSFQCIAGAVLVLFARRIDMPPSWVGFLLSFTPLSMLLVALTVHLVTRFGPKRVMFAAWLARYLVVCFVFLMPWAMEAWGARAAWYVLSAATLGFCVMRAFGVGGWFPWLHEIVPETQRATYFSCEASVVQVAVVLVAFGQAFLLRNDANIGRFLLVYAIGVAAGFSSLAWIVRLPGGAPMPGPAEKHEAPPPSRSLLPVMALHDRTYARFVLVAALCFCSIAWLSSSLVLYMRDALGLFSNEIMLFMAVGSVGVLLTVRFWARFADHSGSGLAMFMTLTGFALSAFACILLIPGGRWTIYGLLPIVFCATMFQAGFWTTAHRAMLNRVSESHREHYTTLWLLGSSLSLGITPILVGIVIEKWGLWGFRTCFAIAGVGGLAGALLCRFTVAAVRAEDRSLSRMLNPAVPIRTLARIVWITIGLHESNRNREP